MAAQPISEFARMYGPYKDTAHSRFTPVEYSFPRHITQEEVETSEKREIFQRKRLRGFTTEELAALDTISDRKLKDGNLRNGIHPVLARDRWENAPLTSSFQRTQLYPVEGGTGLWSSDNDEVWRVLEPCMKLASRILLSIHVLGWFHAFIAGDRRPIAEARCEPGIANGLFSYHVPPAMDPKQTSLLRDNALETLRTKWNLQFCFSKPGVDPRLPDGVKDPKDPPYEVHGLTTINFKEMERDAHRNPTWRMFCFIDYWPLQLLIRNDLTSVQRLQLEWFIGNTVVHEIMHAIDYSLILDIWHPTVLYFEDNAISEVGFDFEAAIFGGTTAAMTENPGYRPLGYWLETKYPSFTDVQRRSGSTQVLILPAPFDHQIFYPIPVTFYEDLQQEGFWDVGVRRFGFPLLYYRTLKKGIRMDFDPTINPQTVGFKPKLKDIRHQHGADPFTGALEKLQNRVSQLETMIVLTPHQKAVRNFGQAILRNQMEEEAFWTGFDDQEDAVQKIIDVGDVIPANEQQRVEAIVSIKDLISELEEYHRDMIVSVFALEEINGTNHTDRKKRLLVWNREMRKFIRQFQEKLNNRTDSAYVASLDNNLIAFERARMKLWPPNSEVHDVADYDEVTELENARSTTNRDICNKILEDTGASIFAWCCAHIMISAMDSAVPEGWEERCNRLAVVMELLLTLQGPQNVPDWIALLARWREVASQTRDIIINIHQAAPGQ